MMRRMEEDREGGHIGSLLPPDAKYVTERSHSGTHTCLDFSTYERRECSQLLTLVKLYIWIGKEKLEDKELAGRWCTLCCIFFSITRHGGETVGLRLGNWPDTGLLMTVSLALYLLDV